MVFGGEEPERTRGNISAEFVSNLSALASIMMVSDIDWVCGFCDGDYAGIGYEEGNGGLD